MKKTLLFGLTVIAALVLSGCKSKESAYKKAYEKAKAAETSYTTTAQNAQGIYNNPQTVVTPTTTTTPTTDFDNTYSYSNTNTSNNNYSNTNTYSNSNNNYNNDNYSTSNVKRYSVVVGSFNSLSGAEGRRNEVVNKGYGSAKIITGGLGYRVVATSFDDLQSAKNSRNALIRNYPDAWVLDKYK
jgi:cell division protein FtsN